MQNVENAAEIQQRVINLVELYRTKVSKESLMAKDLATLYKKQYDAEIDFAFQLHQEGIDGYCLNINIPEEAIDHIRANEQLLGYFYKKVAKDKADEDVLAYFLADKYDSSIFSDDDENFLMNHFAEMVNYIIQTPNNDLSAVEQNERNDLYLLPAEVLELIKDRVRIPSESKIYNPFTGLTQLARLFKDNSFICEESYMPYFKKWNAYSDKIRETEHVVEHKYDEKKLYSWMKVALYANNLDATVLENDSTPNQYDAVISYIPYIPSKIPNYAFYHAGDNSSDSGIINKIISLYQNLSNGGKMVLILPTEYFWEETVMSSIEGTACRLELEPLWKQLISDHSMVEIIQLPPIMGKSYDDDDYCILVAEKGRNDKEITFIDASFASVQSDNKYFNQTLDLDLLYSMIENGGKELRTGLRKSVCIPSDQIKPDFLMPQGYVIEKPSEYEIPIPMTELSSLVTTHIYDVQENLPENTPWVKSENLSDSFRGVLDIATLDTAACPNNPTGWSHGNRKLSNFLMGKNRYSERDIRISIYRNCKYIDGKNDAILFKMSKDGISVAVIEATGKGIAISPNIHVLLPNEKMDALSLMALLRTPMVYRQLKAYEKFGLYGPYGHLKDIFVPTNKRIIGDERHRILQEQKTLKEKEDELAAQKTEYINEVRMRKHDMGQYIFELVNIEDLMRYYIENRNTEKDFCQEIEKLLDNFKSSLGELSSLLDNLSKEEQFGESEEFSLDNYLSQLVNRHKADGFKITYERDVPSIKKYDDEKRASDALDALHVDVHDDASETLSVDEIDDASDALDAIHVDVHDDASETLSVDEIDDASDALDALHVDDLDDTDETLSVDEIDDASNDFIVDDLIVLDNKQVKTISESIPKLFVARVDLHRAVSNIIENARKHGFTDANRSDYVIHIRLSIDNERRFFVLDFRNNGNPLPEGMNKMRYGIKGEKAGQTGGTGIGGNYVKSFVDHYGGDYDVFMENGWTVVRICLPIK